MKSKIFSHLLVLIISFGGAFYCAHLLYLDIYINKSSIDGLVEAGLIKEKHATVKRKFSENMLWDLVDTQSKLYWFDSIQTSDQSQATIQLLDGNEIKLGASSLVVLEKDNDKLALNLKSGQLVLDAKETSKIKVNGVEIKNEGGKTLSLNIDEKKGQLTAIQTAADGTGKQIIIKNDGTTEEKELPTTLIYPAPLFRKTTQLETEKIDFGWNSKNIENIIEISKEKNFEKTILVKKLLTNKYEHSLSPGLYYWRVKSTNNLASETRSIEIVKMQEPQLLQPITNQKLSYRDDLPSIEFKWQPAEQASSYLLELSKDQNFEKVLFTQEASKSNIKTSKLEEGTIYWRVTALYGSDRMPSSVGKIEILKLKEPEPPQLLSPNVDFEVNYDYFEKNQGIPFEWEYRDDAEYRFVLSSSSSFEKTIVAELTKEKSYHLKQSLPEGVYFWALAYKNLDGEWVFKNKRKIKIGSLVAPLDAPAFEMDEVQ